MKTFYPDENNAVIDESSVEENAFCKEWRKCKMQKTDWCEGGLQLADIGTKNVSEPDITPKMKYIMVRIDN